MYPPHPTLPLGPCGLASQPRGAREKLWDSLGCGDYRVPGAESPLSLLPPHLIPRPRREQGHLPHWASQPTNLTEAALPRGGGPLPRPDQETGDPPLTKSSPSEQRLLLLPGKGDVPQAGSHLARTFTAIPNCVSLAAKQHDVIAPNVLRKYLSCVK